MKRSFMRLGAGLAVAAAIVAGCSWIQYLAIYNASHEPVVVTIGAGRNKPEGGLYPCTLPYQLRIASGRYRRSLPNISEWAVLPVLGDPDACRVTLTLPPNHTVAVDWLARADCSDADASNWRDVGAVINHVSVRTSRSTVTLDGLAASRSFRRESKSLCTLELGPSLAP
jgi:hypothetical protein